MSKKRKHKKNKHQHKALTSEPQAQQRDRQTEQSTQLELKWIWHLESDLHCGSGISRAGYADHLIHLNHNGQPEITGDAVKGAIRMSAEQMLAWLGQAQDYPENQTAEPNHPLLKAIFGEQAQVRFEPAVYDDEAKVPPISIRSATAIDSQTGTAKDDTLRQNELLEAGGKFVSRCVIWGTEEERDLLKTFLSAAITATEQIGAKRSIGWGRVRAENQDFNEYLATEKLETLFKAIQEHKDFSSQSQPRLSAEANQDANTWYQLTLTLEEPLCISSTPEISNQTETETCIAASVLKGALQKAWHRRGLQPETYLPWLAENTRWSTAVPSQNEKASIITPNSWFREKQETGFAHSPHGIHDVLSGPLPEREKNNDIIQWKSIGPKWLKLQDNSAPKEISVKKLTTMHVARDYMTGSKRQGALYSRVQIAPGTTFIAYARLPENVDFPETIYLGKRNSAGHGKATLSKKRTKSDGINWISANPEANQRELSIQLLSPLIYRDPDTGYLKRGLSTADWEKLCGLKPQQVESYTQSSSQHGWLNSWQHPRTPLTAIQSGSVWKLSFETPEQAQEAAKKLAEHSKHGLGEQTHQGYGWFVINPSWLGQQKGRPAQTNAPEKPICSKKEADLWPGCNKPTTTTELESLLKTAQKLELPNERRIKGPLQDLAARASHKNIKPSEVMDYCKNMATRNSNRYKAPPKPNPKDCSGAWDFLKPEKKIYPFLKDAADKGSDQLRFALEVLLIEAGQEVSQ